MRFLEHILESVLSEIRRLIKSKQQLSPSVCVLMDMLTTSWNNYRETNK